MLISDFSKGKYHFQGKTTVWGDSGVFVMIYHDGHDGKEQEFLSSIVASINKRLEWIEDNRTFIENTLIENNMIETTEEWIMKAEEIEKGVYDLQGGQKVSLPLTKEMLLSSLRFHGLQVNYEPDEQKPTMDLYIHCKPDYFMDEGCIFIEMNYDKSVECCSILT